MFITTVPVEKKNCSESAIREEELVEQLEPIIKEIKLNESDALDKIKADIDKLKKLLTLIAGKEQIVELLPKIDIKSYAKFILREGSRDEKRGLLYHIQGTLLLQNKSVKLAK